MHLLDSMKKEAFKNLQKNMPHTMAAEQFKYSPRQRTHPVVYFQLIAVQVHEKQHQLALSVFSGHLISFDNHYICW